MARRGFFGRFGDFLRDVFTPAEPRRARARRDKQGRYRARDVEAQARRAEQREYERAAREFERRELEKEERRAARERDPFRRAWLEEGAKRNFRGYRHHREAFGVIPGIYEESAADQDQVWRAYVKYMVNAKRSPYRPQDPSNPFWRIAGIDPRNFDWSEYRAAMKIQSPT